ncbi:sodium-independent anion transporter [Bacillus thuringiensis]|uniref:Sodium-independent anion transporter n=2 Tax=Bacillus thuringiensis TaxID=1428 RepID=A0A9X6TYZ0_BACTU|nr:SulP family inorganic anion transporter [Bacillus thuringiensis]PDX95233.1 sodium-independent anion transporter [Bacillus thuringiensis]PEC75048.1 sodium-independent anion transporter [Bacillus thuringiensis]PED13177.1 sodium-independent anion transporter [Bacillus thuringiensis]PEE61527.1 sodium-independent anion transporter [Bacillus thuringiensis]PEE88963.1 sodium-independent anion transporter [Bacillus thuringiensis]
MRGLFTGRFKGYSLGHFQKDLLSGLIVGVVAIPLAMSFAIASGVKPEYGIYTTCIAGILISLFGGSRYQIGGPTGAFVPILLGIVITYGYEDLLLAGLLAGIILCLMGIFKLGSLIKFIPRPVTIGFTSGIAVIIFTGQIASFLGLTGIKKHEAFIANLKEISTHIGTTNFYSVVTALICFFIILITPKILPKLPGSLVGIVISTVIATIFFSGHVPTIGTAYGTIPNALPQFNIPEITVERIQHLIGPAFVIAMLGGIESLLSAVVADGMTNSKHNSNKELFGQGIANIVTPLFGGIPATGAIARTATNIKSGAVSPMSGVIHGVFVLFTLLLLAPYTSHIPLASMAPILMVVAWNMSEQQHFVHILKMKTGDSLVLLVTFSLTVFTSLTTAVEIGLILAIILFTKRMSNMLVMSKVLPDHTTKNEKLLPHVVNNAHDCPQISIYTIEGPLFFGAAQTFEQNILATIHYRPKILILRMGKVPFIDTTGESYFRNIVQHFKNQGGVLLISGAQSELKTPLIKNGLYAEIGKENFFDHTGEAINCALRHLNKAKCEGCKHFAFHECAQLSQQCQDINTIKNKSNALEF